METIFLAMSTLRLMVFKKSQVDNKTKGRTGDLSELFAEQRKMKKGRGVDARP